MDEDKIFRDSLKKDLKDRMEENSIRLGEAIPKAKEIVDMNPQLDNSREGIELCEWGIRVSIYRKKDLFYLGYTNRNTNLFNPSKDFESLRQLFEELNSDCE